MCFLAKDAYKKAGEKLEGLPIFNELSLLRWRNKLTKKKMKGGRGISFGLWQHFHFCEWMLKCFLGIWGILINSTKKAEKVKNWEIRIEPPPPPNASWPVLLQVLFLLKFVGNLRYYLCLARGNILHTFFHSRCKLSLFIFAHFLHIGSKFRSREKGGKSSITQRT